VYYLAKCGELPAFQLGRSWRFREEDIDRLAGLAQPRPRVLLVDDDEIIRTLFPVTLGARGCQVMAAASVDEALGLTRRYRFDVLLVDLVMPGRGGVDLMRELRGEYSLREMVVVTAFPDLAEAGDLLELGAVTVIRKPFDTDQLVECIEGIIGKRLRVA
jgi:DNA-binding NtrC family response regulator